MIESRRDISAGFFVRCHSIQLLRELHKRIQLNNALAQMNDELTKPLGLKPQKTKGALRPAFVALAVLVLAGAGFVALRILAPQPEITAAQAPAVPQAVPAEPAPAAPAAVEPQQAEPVDDGGPSLAEVEPQGSIEPKEAGESK